MRWAGHVARRGIGEVHSGFWWGNLRGKRPLGRPRHRREDNIKKGSSRRGKGARG